MASSRRLLIYSHDSFGLGHLRRCRTIAHHLVDTFADLSVIILSGSPIIGSFDFKYRVDFVRVPGVIKLRDGDYTALKLPLDIDQTVNIRSSIIKHTADVFDPHMFLVDKEPLGLRGEVRPTLEMLRARGCHCVVGLRDVMDDPALLIDEWERKEVMPVLRDLYDQIWIYGLPEVFNPLVEMPGADDLSCKTHFTGYLKRDVTEGGIERIEVDLPEEPFVLVTAGGGGDGEVMIDWVLNAYEQVPELTVPAVIVFGPFMHLETRRGFMERAAHLPLVHATTFESEVEGIFKQASGIVSMGGYNTFCEILSFEKPALIVPRTYPRREQLLRAERAAELGLVQMLAEEGTRDPRVMALRIQALPSQKPLSRVDYERLLGGLDRVAELSAPWLEDKAEDRQPEQRRRFA